MNNIEKETTDALAENIPSADYGLYQGKMGLCLLSFLHAADKEADDKEHAAALLEEIAEHIDQAESSSFGDGVLGIGWAIEWLAEKKLITLDTNEYLADFDDLLYRLVVYHKVSSIDLYEGILGRILFLYKRITSVSPRQNYYKAICNNECLVLLIHDLYQQLISDELMPLKTKPAPAEVKTLAQALILACKLIPLKFSADLLNKIICGIVAEIIRLFSGTEPEISSLPVHFIYLLHAWSEAGHRLSCVSWVNEAHRSFHMTYGERINALDVDEQLVFMIRGFGLKDIVPGHIHQPVFYQLYKAEPDNSDWAEAWLLK